MEPHLITSPHLVEMNGGDGGAGGEGKGEDGEGGSGGRARMDPVRQISIGHSHFGAITRSGMVYMWGGGEAYGGKVFNRTNHNLF